PGSMEHVQVGHGGDWERWDRDALGAGGRYVCIRHGGESVGTPTLRSCYMHFEIVEVVYGDVVRCGDFVGTVGRMGMRSSVAYLHFELHSEEHLEDPSLILVGILLGRPSPD